MNTFAGLKKIYQTDWTTKILITLKHSKHISNFLVTMQYSFANQHYMLHPDVRVVDRAHQGLIYRVPF